MLAALRDDLIYSQFTGNNLEELRREHKLSQPQLYQIIAKQRKIRAARTN
ncbi:hypothetical protein IOW38_004704 [Salmonella enterica]|nr:hypothetical protein [Salmonella enterica]EGM2645730.1 hypothetical protein [Salmonella enterica]EGM2983776.1 hypothetical protein [Salmonella enterica]